MFITSQYKFIILPQLNFEIKIAHFVQKKKKNIQLVKRLLRENRGMLIHILVSRKRRPYTLVHKRAQEFFTGCVE